jgi:hypothetical protein
VIAEPGRQGIFQVDTMFRFWSGEANLRCELCRGKCYHFDVLFGFRYAELDEDINITSSTNIANVTSHDLFSADNSFAGGQTGLEWEFQYGRLFVDLWGKVAIGNNHQRIINQGNTVQVTDSGTTTTPGGLLALASNSGEFTRNQFAVLPEVGINFGVKLTDHLRVSVGYSFLYLSNVVRPGDQIDTTIDPTQGVPAPPFQFRDTSFWAHGINAGLEFRY